MAIESWVFTKIGEGVLSWLRYLLHRVSLSKVVISPIPELSKIPDLAEAGYGEFTLAFRIFNENSSPVVFRGIQPRAQLPNGTLGDPFVVLMHPNKTVVEFPMVVQSLTKVDVVASFRLQNTNALHVKVDVIVYASTPKKAAPIHVEIFRDNDAVKEVHVNWQGKEYGFGEWPIPVGSRRVEVRFRKKLSSPPQIITGKVEKKADLISAPNVRPPS